MTRLVLSEFLVTKLATVRAQTKNCSLADSFQETMT